MRLNIIKLVIFPAILLSVLAFSSTASAQQGGKNLDLRFFYWPSRIQMDVIDPESGKFREEYKKPPEITLYIPTQQAEAPLVIPTDFRSSTKSLPYRGPASLPVYLSNPVPDENGVLPPPHTTLDLSSYSGSVFILMRVDIDTGEIRFIPIQDDNQKAPESSYTMINLSSKDVAVKLNESTFWLKSRDTHNVLPEGKSRYDALKVAVAGMQGEPVVSSVNLPRLKSSRYLVFVREKPDRENVDLDVIPF